MGRSRGDLATKIHAVLDTEGRPVRLELTAGRAGGASIAAKLLDIATSGAAVIANKAYEHVDQFRQHLPDFDPSYNLARRLETLRDLTPYEAICKAWTDEPST